MGTHWEVRVTDKHCTISIMHMPAPNSPSKCGTSIKNYDFENP